MIKTGFMVLIESVEKQCVPSFFGKLSKLIVVVFMMCFVDNGS